MRVSLRMYAFSVSGDVEFDRQPGDSPDAGKGLPMHLSRQTRIDEAASDFMQAFLDIGHGQELSETDMHAPTERLCRPLFRPFRIELHGIVEHRRIATGYRQ